MLCTGSYGWVVDFPQGLLYVGTWGLGCGRGVPDKTTILFCLARGQTPPAGKDGRDEWLSENHCEGDVLHSNDGRGVGFEYPDIRMVRCASTSPPALC